MFSSASSPASVIRLCERSGISKVSNQKIVWAGKELWTGVAESVNGVQRRGAKSGIHCPLKFSKFGANSVDPTTDSENIRCYIKNCVHQRGLYCL